MATVGLEYSVPFAVVVLQEGSAVVSLQDGPGARWSLSRTARERGGPSPGRPGSAVVSLQDGPGARWSPSRTAREHGGLPHSSCQWPCYPLPCLSPHPFAPWLDCVPVTSSLGPLVMHHGDSDGHIHLVYESLPGSQEDMKNSHQICPSPMG